MTEEHKATAVVVRSAKRRTAVAEATPMEMLAQAVARGVDMEQLQKLMDLQERWEANNARKAFVAAMAKFKESPPEILKDKHVSYENRDGTMTEYDHASLGGVCAAITKGLALVAISHRWETLQNDTGRIKVKCVLTHAMGHSESVELHSAPDESGGKNKIQAIGSAITYLQRYTLLAATGLAAMGGDDDGRGAEGDPENTAPPRSPKAQPRSAPQPKANAVPGASWLNAHQIAHLRAQADRIGVSESVVARKFGVVSIEDLQFSQLNPALDYLKSLKQEPPGG